MITSLTIVYSTVNSGADQRKHQSSASLAFVRGIHRWPVNSPHKGPVTRKMFPFDDVIVVIPVIVAIGMEFHCNLDWFVFTMKRSRFEQGFLQRINNATLKTESCRDANCIVTGSWHHAQSRGKWTSLCLLCYAHKHLCPYFANDIVFPRLRHGWVIISIIFYEIKWLIRAYLQRQFILATAWVSTYWPPWTHMVI